MNDVEYEEAKFEEAWRELEAQYPGASNILGIEVPRFNPSKAAARQVGGNHYRDMKITPTEYIVANNIKWIEANVIKYISRHQSKNGREDVEKALHYCELLLKDYK